MRAQMAKGDKEMEKLERKVHYVKNLRALGLTMPDAAEASDPCQINTYYVYRHSHLTPAIIQQFTDHGFQVYAPMATIQKQQGRHTITQQVSRTMGYMFVYANFYQVEEFARQSQFAPLSTRRKEGEPLTRSQLYVTVPEPAMQVFRTIMDANDELADFTIPTHQQLAKGDVVRVLTGPFAGIQGTLITSQGARTHNVYIHLTEGLGINIRVQDTQVAILGFSRQSNHVTTHLRSIEGEMSAILRHHSQHQPLTSQMIAWLTMHIQRYGSLTGLTHAMAGRYTVHLYLAHQLLGQHQQAHHIMDTYRQGLATNAQARRSAGRTPTTAQYIQHWTALLTQS